MKKLLCLALLILSGVTAPAFSQNPVSSKSSTPETLGLAEKLMNQLEVQKTMETAFQQISKMQDQMMQSSTLTPAQKEKQATVREVVNAEVKDLMNWDKIKPRFIAIYAETFSADELQGMIDFFKSPVGRSWIEKQPAIQAATMQQMQGLMMEIQPKIMEAAKRAMESEKTPEKK